MHTSLTFLLSDENVQKLLYMMNTKKKNVDDAPHCSVRMLVDDNVRNRKSDILYL